MPWFRFRRRKDDPAAEAATTAEEAQAQPEALAVGETDEADEADETTATEGAAARKRRRRGSRGGKGRRKPGASADAAEDGDSAPAEEAPKRQQKTSAEKGEKGERPAEKGEKGEKGSRSRSGQRSGGRERRRQLPRRAPLPQAKRELLISVDVGEQRVAVLEDDRVAEVYLERPERRSIAGNIYLGRVDNVLPGMEAAFVEIGLEKNGFLYVDEIVVPGARGQAARKEDPGPDPARAADPRAGGQGPDEDEGRAADDGDLAARAASSSTCRTARASASRAGSRTPSATRLQGHPQGARRRRTGGVIVRTAAEGASAEDIERDLVFLQRLWKTIQARAEARDGPDARLPGGGAAAPRSCATSSPATSSRAHVDDERTYKRIVGYLKKTSPHMIERVHRYEGQGAALRELRRRRGDRVDARPPRRPALRRLPRLRLRRGVHGHRRQHGPLRRLALEELDPAARGHDHQEQPRGGQGGRPPAAAARHRRDHRHRLHRHGEPEEPRTPSRKRCARSSSATGRRPTSSRSRRSASSR